MEKKKIREEYEIWNGGQASTPWGKIIWDGKGCFLDKEKILETLTIEKLKKIIKMMEEIENAN